MTMHEIKPEPVPLIRDHVGRLVVPGIRVSLDVLVAAFNRGESPEAIRDDYAVIYLEYVYAVISYYLSNRPEVEEYLREQEREGAEIRTRIEAVCPPEAHRANLRASACEPATVRLMADEDIAGKLLVGLGRSVDDVDVVRVKDLVEWDVDDPSMLEWAAEAGRVLVTQDTRTIPDCAYDRVKAGLPMPGVFVLSTMEPIETSIDNLAAAVRVSNPGAWTDQVVYLPPRRTPPWWQRLQEINFVGEATEPMSCSPISSDGVVEGGPLDD